MKSMSRVASVGVTVFCVAAPTPRNKPPVEFNLPSTLVTFWVAFGWLHEWMLLDWLDSNHLFHEIRVTWIRGASLRRHSSTWLDQPFKGPTRAFDFVCPLIPTCRIERLSLLWDFVAHVISHRHTRTHTAGIDGPRLVPNKVTVELKWIKRSVRWPAGWHVNVPCSKRTGIVQAH